MGRRVKNLDDVLVEFNELVNSHDVSNETQKKMTRARKYLLKILPVALEEVLGITVKRIQYVNYDLTDMVFASEKIVMHCMLVDCTLEELFHKKVKAQSIQVGSRIDYEIVPLTVGEETLKEV